MEAIDKEKYEIYSAEGEFYKCNKNFPNCIGFQINWTANIGFGQLTFIYDTKTKDWGCDTEHMSKEFCEAVLNKWLEGVFPQE